MITTKKLAGEWTVVSLEPGTCTERAATKFAAEAFIQKPAMHYVTAFVEGINFAKHNRNTVILLPHIHQLCSDLECDSEWKSLTDFVFPLENPPLYLAENKNNLNNKKCAALITLRKLHNDKNLQFIDAANTQRAAAMTAEGSCRYCITNQDGLEKNNLSIVKELKKMTVFWIPFVYLHAHALRDT